MTKIKSSAALFIETGDPLKVIKVASAELPELKDNEILLQTLIATLNPSDVATVQGIYASIPPRTTLYTAKPAAVIGNEGVFKVKAVGKKVTKVKVGDTVIPAANNIGSWRNYLICKENLVSVVPEVGLTPKQIATSFVNPASAYQMLKEYVPLEKGDWIIQDGGNSNVGRAVIQLARHWGYKTINVVRDRKDFAELAKELKALGADAVITDEQIRPSKFRKLVKEITGKDESPIKLALECVGGITGARLAGTLRENGTMIVYGSMTQQPIPLGSPDLIFRDIIVRGYWLTPRIRADPEAKETMMKEIFKLFLTGVLQLPPLQEHVWKSNDSDAEYYNAAYNAFKTQLDGFANKKQVIIFE